MVARKQKLADSLRLQQLFRDIEDEETWIREKEPIAASTNRGGSIPVSPGFRCQNCSVITCLLMEHSLEISEMFVVINVAWSYTFAITHGSLAYVTSVIPMCNLVFIELCLPCDSSYSASLSSFDYRFLDIFGQSDSELAD